MDDDQRKEVEEGLRLAGVDPATLDEYDREALEAMVELLAEDDET